MSTLHILASVVGYVGGILLFTQVVFGSRHIFSFFTKDTVLINKVHKQMGIYGTLLIFSHPILEMVWRGDTLRWLFVPNFSLESETHITFGRFALYLLIIIWVTSAILRSKMKWRPWKYIHLLSYPLVFMVFIHAVDIGSFFEDYIVFRVSWYILFATFVIATLYRIIAWSAYIKERVSIVASHLQNNSILLLRVTLPKNMQEPEIGQHAYLQTGRFGTEHPFTIMDYHKESHEIFFGMRVGGKFVEEVKNMQVGQSLFIDGPYGVFTREGWNDQEKVIIAGGVGVTPFVRLAREFGSKALFLYANRDIQDALMRDEIKGEVALYRDIVESTNIIDDTVITGRLTPEVLKTILGDKLTKLPFFICGSPLFIEIMKKTLTNLGVEKNRIFYEELGF